MKGLTTIFIATLVFAGAALADSNRVLLRPPDNYEGVTIGGEQFVHGQVYVPQAADTALLTKFGFRDFTWAGSSARYKKFKAWWPIETDVDLLPDVVIGLTYEKLTNEDLARAAIMKPQTIPAELRDDISELRFAGMYPSDGKPDVIWNDRPCVEGTIYFTRKPDKAELRELGIQVYERLNKSREELGLTSKYIEHDAMWPLDLEAGELPSYVAGMVANKSAPDYRRHFADATSVNNYYYGAQQYPSKVYHYNYNYSGGIQDPDGHWRSWRHDFNPDAYYYRTGSRTNLKPTTIGSYPGNRAMIRKGYYRYGR